MAENTIQYIQIPSDKGNVNISSAVIATLAGTAVADIEGIVGYTNGQGTDRQERAGKRVIAKGVRCSFDNGIITVDITAYVRTGYGISTVASQAQAAVISAIEAVTGLTPVVNIHVAGVIF